MRFSSWASNALIATLSLSNGASAAAHKYDAKAIANAQKTVKQALKVVEVVNKERVDHPNFNKLEFSDVVADAAEGPALPYTSDPLSVSRLIGTRSLGGLSSTSGYIIPDDLAEAARIVAESTPQTPKGNQPDIARDAIAKWSMPTVDTSSNVARDVDSIAPRATTYGYWMVDNQTYPGAAPFAASGYKVFRNVKSFGAMGDGVTDDTAAINNAIASGNRCGATCTSSTITPAVVYFPPGTYLVSSPLIQYYNTQFLGDPHDFPTLLAASSFVGLGVITSDVYTGANTEWYLNTNNFLRNVRNFKIDMRLASTTANLCAIHWQVAQAASLEAIIIYMPFVTDTPNNQMGLFMENGSGGFLSNITIVGGNTGAALGNQQFTTSHFVFVQVNVAMQLNWDWAWTMQDYIIQSCGIGFNISGGAGGPDGVGVGSIVLTDTLIADTYTGVLASINGANSSSVVLQNVGFFGVQHGVTNSVTGKDLLTVSNSQTVANWGIGTQIGSTGNVHFMQGTLTNPTRPASLLGTAYSGMAPNWFTRRRPTYYDWPQSKVMNVKAYGAKGDGKTDDTKVINSVLSTAASKGYLVYFPYGVYVITDTLLVPANSRIIGQVWPSIQATGAKFQNEASPHVAVQVGRQGGAVGVVEIQDMLFTVQGKTAGAVLVEWNSKEASNKQGTVGMWDSHFRVGGAKGSNLQSAACPKLTGKVNANCKAASLMLHLTANSNAYLENVWAWTADHDMDSKAQTQIDIYSGRGILIESNKAWLWGTASEHNVLYQYQLNKASNIFLGMIQTETPYFQPGPAAPGPFTPGKFNSDPTFSNCKSGDKLCALAWAVRVVNSDNVFLVGAGLYSFFSGYTQGCLATESCQQRGFQIQGSNNTWIYNLGTKAMVELISPLNKSPVLASKYHSGFLSEVMSWLGASGL